MRRIKIVKKGDLSVEQSKHIAERIESDDHRDDAGPPEVWDAYQSGMYAFFLIEEDNTLIGLAEGSGRPIAAPGWWIDFNHRVKGYGSELVEMLAEYLVKDGVTEIGNIRVEGNAEEASQKLKKRFLDRFSECRKVYL